MTSRSGSAGRVRLFVVPEGASNEKYAASHARPALPAPTLDDSQLVAAVRAGDADAAAALHDRLRPVVERAIRRLLGSGDRDHEDLAQQAMIEVVYSIDRFRGDSTLDAWTSTIAAHSVYKHLRRRVTERRIFEALRDDDVPEPRSLPHSAAARSTLRRVVRHLEAIDDLKAWAFVLHDVCGYDLREVAQITESTVAAAQSRLVRGRKELMHRLAADPELQSMMPRKGDGR
ncbi:RNA polymerase, sigma-24 subunit, ECF subfamily [Labilithrix luteola]|uniref:RNA polymerase, sigma-24 subunit, ECF subfamily n=1 Tax=Labilithrix luteola TaxID=1391654 RepID=A0A0K1Q972_9BACT|nr:RNA polymerase sigma factor [Labilithrix luteola]AKV02278.1 RNA polymerase, sigma-24 subunit, ECF subfamily [Labilithrix luteola]